MSLDQETLLVAKLASLDATAEGRLIRLLLAEVGSLRKLVAVPGFPPCDCGVSGDGHMPHELHCSSMVAYGAHVERARMEWSRATTVVKALRGLFDAVAAEVAMHPGDHNLLMPAFAYAGTILRTCEESKYPGDDGVPF